MNTRKLALWLLLAAGIAATAFAEHYRWSDERGAMASPLASATGPKEPKAEAPQPAAIAQPEPAMRDADAAQPPPDATVENECAALAREIIETPDPDAYAQLVARYNATCPSHSFDCSAARPKTSRCTAARLKDDNAGRKAAR